MKKCLVIGGGFAGLSAAVYLSEKHFQIKLLESSPKLGGRAYSLINEKLNCRFDNGQHIMMGCYENTIDFIRKIGAVDLLDIQKSLQVNFVKPGGLIYQLKTPRFFYPLNLLYGILNYRALSLKERVKIIDFFLDLICCFSEDLGDKNIAEWLKDKKQSDNSIKSFWEILIVGMLNTSAKNASAILFAEVLKRVFFNGAKSASIVIPKTDLSNLYVKQSEEFIKNNSGEICLSERVQKFLIENNRVKKVITDRNEYEDFDFIISAVPAHAFEKVEIVVLDNSLINTLEQLKKMAGEFNYSPILNIHLWLRKNPFSEKFYGLIDSKIHWIFNHGSHISITTSNAADFIPLGEKEILSSFYSEIEKYFPIFNQDLIMDSKVIKEKRATFIPDTRTTSARERVLTMFGNLIIAGDWANTGLPSTIEGAVLSGMAASEKCNK
jgi:hydroxysqualene dehydroxylase